MVGDVGGSTTGRASRRERLYHIGHDALENWGAFLRATKVGPPQYQGDPIFREVRSGYREANNLRSDYHEDYALQCDRMFARIFRPAGEGDVRDLDIAVCGYVMCKPSRPAGRMLKLSPDEYRQRLDELVARVDAALAVSRMPMRFGIRVE